MPKLTDSQLVILSAAARREDGAALPLPKSLKLQGGAAASVLKSLIKKGLLEETPAVRDAAACREETDGRRMTLVITKAGLQVIDGAPAEQLRKRAAPAKAKARKPRASQKTIGPKPQGAHPAPTTLQGTKQALLIDLLRRKAGATIDEIVQATGWQAHSVRGAISGTLKKKLGLSVASEKIEGRGRVYRIARRS